MSSTALVVFTPTAEQLADATKKGDAWKTFGYNMSLTNLALIDKAAKLKPTLPTKVEDIAAAEKTLADLKTAFKDIQTERKVPTGKIDAVTSALMKPEKQIEQYIKELSDALLPLKRLEKDDLDKKQKRTDELRRFTETTQIQYNEAVAFVEKTIERLKSEKYEAALEKIEVNNIANHVLWLKGLVRDNEFYQPIPQDADPEKQEILTRIFSAWDNKFYIEKYKTGLDTLFVDFATAKANKTDALLALSVKQEAATNDINQATEMKNVVASMDAVSYSGGGGGSFAPATRALKEFWVVDMPHTESNMIHIMRAFAVNIVLTMPTLQVKDCFNIDINKMAQALANVKNNTDPNFQPDKIIFKKSDKI